MEVNNKDIQLTLEEVVYVLFRYKYLIIIVSLLSILISFFYFNSKTVVYSAKVIINSNVSGQILNIEKVKPLTTSEGSGVSSSFMNPSSLYDFDLLFDTFYNKISSYGYVESKILQYLKRENSIDANLMKAYSQTIAKSLQTEINSNEFIKLGGRSITFTLSFADKELLAKIIDHVAVATINSMREDIVSEILQTKNTLKTQKNILSEFLTLKNNKLFMTGSDKRRIQDWILNQEETATRSIVNIETLTANIQLYSLISLLNEFSTRDYLGYLDDINAYLKSYDNIVESAISNISELRPVVYESLSLEIRDNRINVYVMYFIVFVITLFMCCTIIILFWYLSQIVNTIASEKKT